MVKNETQITLEVRLEIFSEEQALCRTIICEKYGVENGEWLSREVRSSQRTSMHKTIKWERDTMALFIHYRRSFWKDKWCDEVAPTVVLQNFFQIATNRKVSMDEIWDQERGRWNPNIVRSLNDWELHLLKNLFAKLRNQKVDRLVED